MIRLYIKWFASVLLLWAAQIVGLIVVPVAIIDARRRRWIGLPEWAQAWDNADAPYGDVYWTANYRDPGAFWPRFRWLALRNRAHNLSRWLGIADAFAYQGEVDARAAANSYGSDDRRWTGRMFVVAYNDNADVIAWESYGVLPYPFTGGRWGIRWRFGWKIKGGDYEDRPHRLVCNVMPLRRIG